MVLCYERPGLEEWIKLRAVYHDITFIINDFYFKLIHKHIKTFICKKIYSDSKKMLEIFATPRRAVSASHSTSFSKTQHPSLQVLLVLKIPWLHCEKHLVESQGAWNQSKGMTGQTGWGYNHKQCHLKKNEPIQKSYPSSSNSE